MHFLKLTNRTMKKVLLALLCLAYSAAFAQMPNTLTPTEKVYGLSKFWQEVNYNFVYLNKIDRNQWDKDYQQLITEVQETENDYEYFRLLQKFCASLKDGHTNIYPPSSVLRNLQNASFGDFKFATTNIDNRAIITHISASKKDQIPIGTEIIEVNGQDTQSYLDEKVLPYISSSTDYIRMDKAIRELFQAPIGTSYEILFKFPDGNTQKQNLTLAKTEEMEIYPEIQRPPLFEFEWLDEGLAYVSLNGFSNPQINELFTEKIEEIRTADRLIIDLRNNGGGQTTIGTNILQYLTFDDELYLSASESRLHIPSFKAWGAWTTEKDTLEGSAESIAWNKQALLSAQDNYFHEFGSNQRLIDLPKEERMEVPTVILIGNNTASAAEDFLIAADNQEHMTKIGEPTFGSTGQPLRIVLPGRSSARICTKKDTYPDGREFVGYGIQPDILVNKTVDDFINDRDPVLTKAIEFLIGDF